MISNFYDGLSGPLGLIRVASVGMNTATATATIRALLPDPPIPEGLEDLKKGSIYRPLP